MFSGQGSQHYHMGSALFDHEPVFRDRMLYLDDIVRKLSGKSILDALYAPRHGKADAFALTSLSHPAIFMVEYSLAELLISSSIVPDLTLGCSMGSFAAAAVAGFIDVEDALTAVVRQATALETHCKVGGMTAVLSDPKLYSEDILREHSELAGINFSSHFVISAPLNRLDEIESALSVRNISYLRLPVSFAFHSRWIDQAEAPFAALMRSIRPANDRLPMMCCERAAIIRELPSGYFWSVVRNRIRFRDAVANLEQQGNYRYIDVGPSSTLATFLKYQLNSLSASTIHPILTPYGHEQMNLRALLASRADSLAH
jgi:acyl transferase domain-containing protein